MVIVLTVEGFNLVEAFHLPYRNLVGGVSKGTFIISEITFAIL